MSLREKYARTVCDCEFCRVPCCHKPGLLIPEDLPVLCEALGKSDAPGELLDVVHASEGALLLDTVTNKPFRVPTLVMAARPDGRCVMLGADGKCKIHEKSPFGCSRFDTHMTDADGHERMVHAIRDIAMSFQDPENPYRNLHEVLTVLGRVAPPLHERAAACDAAYAELGKKHANKTAKRRNAGSPAGQPKVSP